MLIDPVKYAIPFFVLSVAVEIWLYVKRRASGKGYALKDTATSLLLGTGSQISGFLTAGLMYGIVITVHS